MKKNYFLLLVFSSLMLNAQCWEKIACGPYHTAGIKNDGTLWMWGNNQYGQLGIGVDATTQTTGYNRNVPVQVGTDSWQSVALGNTFSAAVKIDGSLWCWGRNDQGQLGGGTMYSTYNTPIRIGTDNNWKSVACGNYFTVAIKTDGTLWTWGVNSSGSLGSGTTNSIYAPAQIGTDTNWKMASAKTDYALAIKTNGTLWGWGENTLGQLGDGTNVDKLAPTQIGTLTNWAYISAGGNHSLGITSDGRLRSWGANYYSQLGTGGTAASNVPVLVGSDSDWLMADASLEVSYVIKTNGKLYHFGAGYGLQTTPTQISTATDWTDIKSNNYRTMQLNTAKDLYGNGANDYGQVGTGTNSSVNVATGISCTALGFDSYLHPTLSIYPVPVKQVLNLSFGNSTVLVKSVAIIDMQGKVILKSENKSQLDLSNLEAGIYCIKVLSDNGIFNSRFIKE
ncbi:MAG: T9SS type A sorting domain-containing protein [Flavobacterium sp.]